MATIRPFRDYDEHEVINLFAFDGGLGNKGTFVTAVGNGFDLSKEAAFGNDSFIDGTVSARFNVASKVTAAPSGTVPAKVLGMMLKDVRSVDENGYPLKFEPRKAAERDVIISGEAVPVVKRGLFLYSGVAGTPGEYLSTDGKTILFNCQERLCSVDTTKKDLGQSAISLIRSTQGSGSNFIYYPSCS